MRHPPSQLAHRLHPLGLPERGLGPFALLHLHE
jgi:hypothetical protein